uniref:Uncharacterized protein n=1 Tax=Echinococcus canadensis TaxID=519352 RepID=A0A915EVZ1_9CEST
MSVQEIKQCLTLLKQALSCPICLDDLKQPVITPCSHIFCEFCLDEYMLKKRSIRCPICNKDISKRALTSAEKFKQIASVGKKIIDDFVEESKNEFVPVTKFEQLHLSQEFSQAQHTQPKVVKAKSKSSETVGISSLKSGFSLMTKRISRRDQPRTSKRMAIALGTSARILKHHMRSKEGASVLNIDELTQPMRVQPTEEALSCELFTMTQTPPLIKPSVMRLDEFPDLSNKRSRAQSADVSGVSMRRPPRDGEDEPNCSHRGSKLSLASAFKRSSFLRSLSRGRKRQNQSQSSESSASLVSSDIPPLRERLSTSAATPTRKKRRRTNELYSPWLHNSRLHFLKKYRIPPVSSKPRTSLPPTSANVFSPAWSRLKSLGTEFGRQSKTQLLIRSMKKCSSSRVAFKPVETAVQPPNLGPVCRFILPSRGPWFEGSEKGKTAALLCSHCGSEIIFISNPATVLTSPIPYPVVRDSRAYWPELWQQSPQVITGQGDVSAAVTSAVTTLPSYVPPISLNSRQPCDPARCEETNQLQIPMTPEKGTPSTINIQPSLVPQSFSLNTPSSKLSCEEQAEAAKLDTPPSPQTVSSSDTSSLPATVINSVDIQPTPTLPAANPIIPETPLQTMATGSQVMTTMHEHDHRENGTKDDIERDEQQQNRGDLEAVSRLEQQLLEESLNAELLANPGTEPTESEAEVISPSSPRESSTITTFAVCPAPVSSGLSPLHGLNEISDHPSSTDKITREMTKLDMIPDSNALEEDLDVIPSSQNEEETKEGEIQVISDEPMDAMETPQTEAISVPLIRVESSQPVTAATFEALPLSQTPSCTSAADTIPFTQPRLLSTSLIADTENVNPRSREDESTQPTIFITGSNLSPIEVNALRRFCRQFNAMEMSSFESNRTTHVVMATQVTRPRVAQRTLKYFMGILNGAWVVNTHWVRKCLLAATLLPEEPFEVQGDTMCGDCHEGPRRGRLRVSAIPPSLGTSNRPAASVSCPDQRRPFAGLMLCPFGDISPLNPKDFEALVIAGGGIPIADPSLFPSEVVSTTTTTTTTTTGATEINPKCLIFTCPTAPKFQKQDCIDIYNKYKIPVINLNWMLNCASVYRRLPMSKATLRPKTTLICIFAKENLQKLSEVKAMNIYESVRAYFSKMFAVPPGMKVLIVDEETLVILSVTMAFSEIMERDIFLVERIKSTRESLNHLTGVYFVRPTSENVTLISQELKSPKYASYFLFFSHALSKQSLKQLAEADIHEVVMEVQEYFVDFLALSPHLFAIERPICFSQGFDVIPEVLSRSSLAITAVLLTLQWLPQIRYQQSSDHCRVLAESVRSFCSRETDLFDSRKPDRLPVLLILDRRQDQITPLLTQWTYEAMIHELIGIKNNRVVLHTSAAAPDKMSELTLSREFDDFFKTNQYVNFGEIGQAIKNLVANFQKVTKKVDAENAKSISDLKGLLENYPDFRKASGTVEIHVAIVSELSQIVKSRSLLEISEVEQELVCQNNHSTSYNRIRSLVSDPRIKNADALRLVILYALRYELNLREISMLSAAVIERGVPKDDVRVIEHLSDHPSSQKRVASSDLLSAVRDVGSSPSVSNATNAVASITKRLVKGRKNVENVYTQHEPLIVDILRELIQGQLQESGFPTLDCGQGSPSSLPAKKIVVFILGGATYEESLAVHKLMSSTPGLNVVLGGTTVHNSESFLHQLRLMPRSELQTEDVETVPGPRSTSNRFPTSLGLSKLRKVPAGKNARYSLLRDSIHIHSKLSPDEFLCVLSSALPMSLYSFSRYSGTALIPGGHETHLSEADAQSSGEIEQNPYRSFLIRKAKTEFYDKADGRMVLIFQPLFCFPWELMPVKNKLFENGLHKRLLAAFSGMIQHRLMTRDEVKKYATLGDLPAVHAELLGTLQRPMTETGQLLDHHGGHLSTLLQYHSKSGIGRNNNPIGASPTHKCIQGGEISCEDIWNGLTTVLTSVLKSSRIQRSSFVLHHPARLISHQTNVLTEPKNIAILSLVECKFPSGLCNGLVHANNLFHNLQSPEVTSKILTYLPKFNARG